MFRRVLSPALVCALIFLGLPLGAMPASAVSPNVVISQIYGGGGNSGATFKNDFIELFNRGPVAVSLSGWSVQYASATGTSWNKTDLSGSIAAGGYYLIQEAAGTGGTVNLPSPDASGTIAMSASAGKVALRSTNALIVTGTLCPTSDATVVDFVGYGTAANCFEGAGPAPGLTNSTAARRLVNGTQDTDVNSADFIAIAPAPRALADVAPSISSTTPGSGVGGVARNANLTVSFSEPVTVDGTWFGISCAATGAHTGTVSGAGPMFTIDPSTDFAAGEICTVTVFASQVKDQDTNDPPDNMAANYSWSFTIDSTDQCGDPATRIHDIQGSGTTSPVVGAQRTIEGVVIGDYQATGQFGGFYVQEEDADADADPATSEGIFVATSLAAAAGDVVRVAGTVAELAGSGTSLTDLTTVSRVLVCASGKSVTPTTITLPVPSLTYFERYEGMLVDFSQTLTATENFTLGRFGEVRLSANGRLYTPTAVTTPGAAAIALADLNQRSSFILDDGDNRQNIDPTIHPTGGLSAANTLRSGYTVNGIRGVFDQRFGKYRLQPVGPVPFAAANPRTAAPASVGGNTRIASFNVLNFFNGDGLGGGFPTARGANTSFEFGRQKAKEISALVAMNADIVGLMELENDATPNSAIEELVAGLNAALGAGTYAFIDTGVIGTDAIKVGLIYKPATVTPVGAYKLMTSSVDPRFVDTLNRPSLAQTFERNGAGARLTVVVNHLKSKGSACSGDPDTGDGQGNCNVTRRNAAAALVDWLATDPTASGDSRVLLIGDMNAYTFEDPITTFTNGGFTNLARQYNGLEAYTYIFDGQSGYLDHALASSALAAQVTGTVDWHINADEPTVLDYNVEFKTANQINTFYDAGPYRSSDHDPVVVGLDLRDTTPPKITGAATTAPNALGWYTADVTASFICTDNLAVVSCGPDVTLSTDGAGRSVTGTATDAAGNTASFTVSGINIDKTAPTITFGGNAGTYSIIEVIAITCTAMDALSGLASQTCPTVNATAYTVGLGRHTLTATATDTAGNLTTVTATFTVTADTTSLCTLTRTFIDNAGIANSLCRKLDAAAAAAARGQRATARNILDAYAHEVEAQRGKKITDANATILIAIVTTL